MDPFYNEETRQQALAQTTPPPSPTRINGGYSYEFKTLSAGMINLPIQKV